MAPSRITASIVVFGRISETKCGNCPVYYSCRKPEKIPFLSNLRDPLEIHSAGEKQILNADAKKTSGFYCSNFSPLRRRRAFSLLEVSIVVKN